MAHTPGRPLGRPPKKKDHHSTKHTIVNVATGLFLNKGFPLVTMDDVAEKSDVTKATVYYYYKTKADLFTDAMIQLMTRIRERIVDILSANKPLKEKLFNFAKAHLQATVDIDIHTFMKEAKTSLSTEQQQLMEEAERNMYDELENALSKAMDTGEISKNNSLVAAHMFVAILTAGNTLNHAYKENFASLDHMITEMVDLYWNGLSH